MKTNVNRMEIGSTFTVTGYDLVAKAACDHGWVLVLSNNSSHLLVAEQGLPDDGQLVDTAVLTASYGYAGPGAMLYTAALKLALARMSDTVLQHTADCDTTECCPSCGSKPGDGRTDGCFDPDGCGYWGAFEHDAGDDAPEDGGQGYKPRS
jgi:hypothetical protein